MMRRVSVMLALALLTVVVTASPAAANLGESATEVTASPTTSSYGSAVNFHVTVTDESGSCDTGQCDTPRGQVHLWYSDPNRPFDETKVKFLEANLVGFISLDRSTIDVDYCCLPVGTWRVRAFYVPPDVVFGPGNYQGEFDASSGDTTVTVERSFSLTSLTQSSTSSAVGDSVMFTAQVSRTGLHASATKPSGTVDLVETTSSGTSTRTVFLNQSNGTATFTVSDLTPGSHTFHARYQGDGNFAASQSSPAITHTVGKRESTSSVLVSPASAVFGQTVTFSATVAPDSGTGTPTGSVTFQATDDSGTVTLGTRSLSGGTASLTKSDTPVGSFIVRAVYAGDGTFEGSTSNGVGLVVSKAQSSTQLGASPTSSTYGQNVTFAAAVLPVSPSTGSPSGTVQFRDGDTVIGSGSISGGVATFSTAALPAGTHEITALYSGDGGFAGSTSTGLSLVIAKADTSTVVTSSSPSPAFGEAVTFTATVSALPPGAGAAPTGTVQFKDGTADLGPPQPVTSNTATFTYPGLTGGSHAIIAVYTGDANFNSSTSPALFPTVVCDTTISGLAGKVTVSATGSTCIDNASVSGNLTIPAGAKVSITNAEIAGSLSSDGAALLAVCGSSVGGSVKVSNTSGFLLMGDPGRGCLGNRLKNSVTLSSNQSALMLGGNDIKANVKVTGTRGAGPLPQDTRAQIEANTIRGGLTCSNNIPTATDNGRPNTVRGKRSGECAAAGF